MKIQRGRPWKLSIANQGKPHTNTFEHSLLSLLNEYWRPTLFARGLDQTTNHIKIIGEHIKKLTSLVMTATKQGSMWNNFFTSRNTDPGPSQVFQYVGGHLCTSSWPKTRGRACARSGAAGWPATACGAHQPPG